MLKLFREANGRDAHEVEEPGQWIDTAALPPGPIDPFEVLSDEEIRAEGRSWRLRE